MDSSSFPLLEVPPDTRLGPTSAFLIVDMQPVFLKSISRQERRVLVNGVRETVSYAHDASIPIYVVEYGRPVENSPTYRSIFPRHVDMPARLQKTQWSAFSIPSLHTRLKESGVSHLHVAGLYAPFCVRETIIDALELGFRVSSAATLVDNKGLCEAFEFYQTHTCFGMSHTCFFRD